MSRVRTGGPPPTFPPRRVSFPEKGVGEPGGDAAGPRAVCVGDELISVLGITQFLNQSLLSQGQEGLHVSSPWAGGITTFSFFTFLLSRRCTPVRLCLAQEGNG